LLFTAEQESLMREALSQAQLAASSNEIPVGAVLVREGQILARAHNTREADKNPLRHAEIKVIQDVATKRGDWRLNDCTLYVTLEPCPMCLGTLFQARVGKLIIGCFDEKRMTQGEANPRNAFPSLADKLCDEPLILTSNNHNLEILGGLLRSEASELLKTFFKKRRQEA
jgi:tRNA(adenine34) deaminase